jgi:hypothetical protein
MNLKKQLLAAAFMSTVAIAGTLATSAQAAINVFTGYADNLRPSGFFPTPWLGDAGVVSETPAGQSLDTGAVRIENLGASAITVSNFTVMMNGGSGPTYAIWAALTIGAGQNGIFTQTSSYNFDSSDNSTGGPPGGISGTDPGSNGIGGCSSTAAAQALAGITAYCAGREPIVSFDIGADHFSFHDSGHILDTGNYDFINGSADGNESINWNVIGGGATRGGSGIPEPSSWVMMLVGFAGLGAALRLHRREDRKLAALSA